MVAASTTPRYVRTFVAWLLGVAVPPLVSLALIFLAVSARCDDDAIDCSWGLEVLLLLPVVFLCLFAVGPAAVYCALRLVRDPLPGRTVKWAVVVTLPSLALAVLTGGLALLVLPPLGGRYMALRQSRRAAGWDSEGHAR